MQPDPNYGIDFGVYGIGTPAFFGYATPPDGVGYLAQVNPGLFTGPIVFDFPTPQLRVGGFIATDNPGEPPSEETMSVYSVAGNLLESVSVKGILTLDRANDFVGIQPPEGLSPLTITSRSVKDSKHDDGITPEHEEDAIGETSGQDTTHFGSPAQARILAGIGKGALNRGVNFGEIRLPTRIAASDTRSPRR